MERVAFKWVDTEHNKESDVKENVEENERSFGDVKKDKWSESIGGLDLTLEDKINAIFDMIPMIKEAHMVSMFMLENRWFDKAYKWYVEKNSKERAIAEINAVFDYYWLPYDSLNKIEVLYSNVYHKESHVDIICKYLAMDNKSYDRSRFIIKELPKDEKPIQQYNPVSNPQVSSWRP